MRRDLRDQIGSSDVALITKTIGLLLMLLLLVTIFAFGGMALVDRVIMPAFTSLGSEVELPDIVDQDFYTARRTLAELGLYLEEIDEDFSAVIDEGYIIDQTPPPFTRVKNGRTVGVVVSRGPEEIYIPNLLRLHEEQARAKLREAGLIVGNVNSRPDDALAGTIIDQNPRPNVKSLRNTPVDVVLSTGPAQMRILIPRLVNQGLDQALDTIRDLKGRVWVEWVEDDTSLFLTVIGQSPEPGMMMEGSPVFELQVALRTGAFPPEIDTTGIGVPPPRERRRDTFPPTLPIPPEHIP
jgi:serine/threonine-protein kinase